MNQFPLASHWCFFGVATWACRLLRSPDPDHQPCGDVAAERSFRLVGLNDDLEGQVEEVRWGGRPIDASTGCVKAKTTLNNLQK
jgi:hypothetical protein